jgi:hypothetical protein
MEMEESASLGVVLTSMLRSALAQAPYPSCILVLNFRVALWRPGSAVVPEGKDLCDMSGATDRTPDQFTVRPARRCSPRLRRVLRTPVYSGILHPMKWCTRATPARPVARHVVRRVLNPPLLSQTASYDVVSSIWRAMVRGVQRHAAAAVPARHARQGGH